MGQSESPEAEVFVIQKIFQPQLIMPLLSCVCVCVATVYLMV